MMTGETSEAGRPSCQGTQFDKITTRCKYWEVLSPPSVHFNEEFFRIFCFFVSLVVILRNWVCDNWVDRLPKTSHLRVSSRT